MKKIFQVKRGNLKFKEVVEFNSKVSEFIWKLSMRYKGCIIKEIEDKRNS
ncbi:hypothetical protein [Clostridium sp.]